MTDPVLEACDRHIAAQKIDTKGKGWKTSLRAPTRFDFAGSKRLFWVLETSHGPLRIRLLHESAPMHVSSTIFLTRLGFYDGLSFHRVIPGFMAQGGCPLGTGTGGPGYKFDGEFAPGAKHDRPGLLSMANAGPGTDGSQFFLTFVPTPWLDGKHTIFGEVVSGKETLQALEKRGSQGGRTSEPLSIRKATIEAE